MRKRDHLLLIGMGLALFAVAGTAINVILLPFARDCYGYGAASALFSGLLCGALLLFAGRSMEREDEAQLERIAKYARPALCLALLLVHLAMGYLMEYTPMGDNHMLYDGSHTLARLGNFGGDDYDLYLSRFSNQWGFFLMMTGFHKLLLLLGIESRFYALVLVQAALYVPAMHCLLGDARKLRGVRGELMLALLLSLCLPLYLAAAVLYTDTFSLPFVVFTLHFALKVPEQTTLRGVLRCAALCGLCAFIGCQIKMTVAIVLIAAAIIWLLTMHPARAAAASVLSAMLVIGGTQALHGSMTAYVLDPAMVAQHNTPTIHWVMMSIPSADNPYGGPTGDYGITWGMQEEGASREAVMASIYSRMKDKIYTLRYPNRLITAMLRKNAASQGDGTFGMTEMLDDGPVRENAVSTVVLSGRPLYPLYSALTSGVWYAVLVFAALSIYEDMRRRDMRCAVVTVAVFGMLLFLLLWEARSRYMFSFVPLMLLLACGSLSRPAQCIKTIGEGRLCQRRK